MIYAGSNRVSRSIPGKRRRPRVSGKRPLECRITGEETEFSHDCYAGLENRSIPAPRRNLSEIF